MWSNRINSFDSINYITGQLPFCTNWVMQVLIWGGLAQDVYISVFHECRHLARQRRFFGGTPVCLVPSPWGRRLSRVHSSSPRWPSAVLGRVSMGPRGRKPASPLPWGSRRFTSVPKVIIALRYGIKTIRALVLDSSSLGMEVINRGRWWGWGGGGVGGVEKDTSGNAWN